MSLGCAIIAYNEEDSIERTLKSVAFCDQIVVVDSGSTDKTVEIAKRYTPYVYYHPWQGYGVQKNIAIEKLNTDWVLSVDADEAVTPALAKEIIKTLRDPLFDAYLINIQLVFMGKRLFYGGTYPDYHLRLFKKGVFRFKEDSIHEGVEYRKERAGRLKNVMFHYSYRNLTHYIEKLNRYTSLIAQKHAKEGKRVGKLFPFTRMGFEILKRFGLKAAFLDGYEGCVYALLSSFYAFVKYAKLEELTRR